jgi:predicted permease
MEPLRHLWNRLRRWTRRRDEARAIEEEMAFHIRMETRKNLEAGMDPAAARRAARLAFGGVDRFAETVRDVRRARWTRDLFQDVHHALRVLRRSPGFTVAAVLTLALGAGANTAVFAVVHAVLLNPLPYAEPERLVRIWERNPQQGIDRGSVSPATYVELRARSRTLQDVALFSERPLLVSDGSSTWQAPSSSVTAELFGLLGVRPLHGRAFLRELSSADVDEAVLGYGLWQRRFGGRLDVLGETIVENGRWPITIVGIMPQDFDFPNRTEIWTDQEWGETVSASVRQYRYHGAMARLRPGITLDAARQEVAAIAAQLETEHPASNAGWTFTLEPLHDSIVGNTRILLWVLLGLVTCVLLIACSNVAGLMIARAAARSQETALRRALGAGRFRLVRQWLSEAFLLAGLGGVMALAVAWSSQRLVLALAPGRIPRLAEVELSGPVLLFALALTLGTAVLTGLAPALHSHEPAAALRTRTRGASQARAREWLVGVQAALTLVLLVAASLLFRSFVHLRAVDPGFDPRNVIAAELRVAGGRLPAGNFWFEQIRYFEALMAELRAVPGVDAVAGVSDVPLSTPILDGTVWRADAPGAQGTRPPASAADRWEAGLRIVTPGYFEMMQIPVLRGRGIQSTDRFTEPQFAETSPRPTGVVVINQAMANRYWPSEDPIGQSIVVFEDQHFAAARRIVGIVGDVRAHSVAEAASPTVFMPFAEHPGRDLALVFSARGPLGPLQQALTAQLQRHDALLSLSSMRPLSETVARSISLPLFSLALAGSFALLALGLAGVGIFGTVAWLVARRTQEIGVRMALGAPPHMALWLVASQGLRPVLVGAAAGALAGLAVARGMRALLFELAPIDPASFAAATALLLLTAALAAWGPARTATRIDPMQALRRD